MCQIAPVWQRAEHDPPDHDPAEVDGGDERGDEGPVADQAPLGHHVPLPLPLEVELVPVDAGRRLRWRGGGGGGVGEHAALLVDLKKKLFFLVILGAWLWRTPSLSGPWTHLCDLEAGYGGDGLQSWWGGTGIWTRNLLHASQES